MNTNEAITILASRRDLLMNEVDAIDLLVSTARGFLTSETVEEKLIEGDKVIVGYANAIKPTMFEKDTSGE